MVQQNDYDSDECDCLGDCQDENQVERKLKPYAVQYKRQARRKKKNYEPYFETHITLVHNLKRINFVVSSEDEDESDEVTTCFWIIWKVHRHQPDQEQGQTPVIEAGHVRQPDLIRAGKRNCPYRACPVNHPAADSVSVEAVPEPVLLEAAPIDIALCVAIFQAAARRASSC